LLEYLLGVLLCSLVVSALAVLLVRSLRVQRMAHHEALASWLAADLEESMAGQAGALAQWSDCKAVFDDHGPQRDGPNHAPAAAMRCTGLAAAPCDRAEWNAQAFAHWCSQVRATLPQGTARVWRSPAGDTGLQLELSWNEPLTGQEAAVEGALCRPLVRTQAAQVCRQYALAP